MKTAIIYYSMSGNTTYVANILKEQLDPEVDLIMLAVFVVAVLPLCFLPRYRKSLKKNQKVRKVISIVIYHFKNPDLHTVCKN